MSNVYALNRRAMTVPRERLVDEIKGAVERKKEILAQRDKDYGADRPFISSYMENLTLPELFGFEMIDYYRDPQLAMDVDLRAKLFWLENSHDDGLASLEVFSGSMYYDMTLFGLRINYQPNGVPIFDRHALADDRDLSQLKPFDFYVTGEMPMVHNRYNELTRISKELYGGEVKVNFPWFHRGPLDIAIQLREYDNFVADCAEEPGYVHELLGYIVSERARFNTLAAPLHAPPAGAPTTYIADDWINVPFVSPAMFDEFIAPAYRKIQENEGMVTGFHTCGVYTPLVQRMLELFPGIKTLDDLGWNDLSELDRLVDKSIGLTVANKNSFILCATADEHRQRLEETKKAGRGRRLTVCSSAIVRLHDTIDESIYVMNGFIDLAREVMAE